jgi:hypothetical protein
LKQKLLSCPNLGISHVHFVFETLLTSQIILLAVESLRPCATDTFTNDLFHFVSGELVLLVDLPLARSSAVCGFGFWPWLRGGRPTDAGWGDVSALKICGGRLFRVIHSCGRGIEIKAHLHLAARQSLSVSTFGSMQ